MSAITPAYDPTTRAIASYLQEFMNAQAAADHPELGKCVAGVRDFYTQLNTQDRIPLLMVYRVSGQGDRHTLRADYYMPAYNDPEKQSGILNYARYWILRLLAEYNLNTTGYCRSIPEQDFQYQILFTTLQRAVHPLVRVTFIVEEY